MDPNNFVCLFSTFVGYRICLARPCKLSCVVFQIFVSLLLARLLPKGRGYAKGGEWRISEAIDLSKPAVVERLKKLESLGVHQKNR